jgi:hypothetical protein
MNNVANISAEVIPAAANNLVMKAMAVVCGLSLVVLACLATSIWASASSSRTSALERVFSAWSAAAFHAEFMSHQS